jgi:Xaa-Pro aminopeptidase
VTAPTLPAIAHPAHLPLVPPAELTSRAERFAARLRDDGLDGAFLLHPSSLFWISGTLSDAYPFVTADAKVVLPLRTGIARAARESPLPQATIRRLPDLPGALAELGVSPEGAIGVELDVVPVATFRRLEKLFPDVELRDCSRAIREVRAIKSEYEITWIEKAAEILRVAMDEVLPEHGRTGVTEIELTAFLEGELRARRHQGIIRLRRWNMEMYIGVMSSGASASYPCYFDGPDGLEALYPAIQQGGGERRLEPGVTTMVDFVGGAGGYLADRTRIFAIGEPPAKARDAHAFCLDMLEEITSRLKPGAAPSVIHEEVVKLASASPFANRFMGYGENRVAFLGHGIGIDLDELPVLAPRFDLPLATGNVIAVEPKVFLGETGGVGVENTYVVTESGCRNLTSGPEEIRVVSPGGDA